MSKWQKISVFLLRISLGWLFFYAGITKLINPNWSAQGFLNNAKTFSSFYQWLTSDSILPIVNALNEWGLTLIGISLILGIAVRLSTYSGALLMILYYFPRLTFPYPDANSFIVDQHIIYICILLFLGAIRAGHIYGLENWCINLPVCKRFPQIRKFLG
ncbi:MAG: DoxX family protein [Candidatus Magasanikbacteria bacterium]|nr:DoxX family protein [Candidatus Magasanikbacteria bacterium]